MGYRLDIRRAYARISSGSEMAETACGPIEYAVVGAGLPLLSVHGAAFDEFLSYFLIICLSIVVTYFGKA